MLWVTEGMAINIDNGVGILLQIPSDLGSTLPCVALY